MTELAASIACYTGHRPLIQGGWQFVWAAAPKVCLSWARADAAAGTYGTGGRPEEEKRLGWGHRVHARAAVRSTFPEIHAFPVSEVEVEVLAYVQRRRRRERDNIAVSSSENLGN